MRIKSRSLPKRCEVCHQVDMFDAEKDYCSRCSHSLQSHSASKPDIKGIPSKIVAIPVLIEIVILTITGWAYGYMNVATYGYPGPEIERIWSIINYGLYGTLIGIGLSPIVIGIIVSILGGCQKSASK